MISGITTYIVHRAVSDATCDSLVSSSYDELSETIVDVTALVDCFQDTFTIHALDAIFRYTTCLVQTLDTHH